jgi:hypothetical protein
MPSTIVQVVLIMCMFKKCSFILMCSNNLDCFQLVVLALMQIAYWPSPTISAVHLLLALLGEEMIRVVEYFLVTYLCCAFVGFSHY